MFIKNLVVLLTAFTFTTATYAGDKEIAAGILGFLIAGAVHSAKHEHVPPTREYGIYHEPINSRIARTHCPIVEHVIVYNRYGGKEEYLVRDCRR